MAADSKVYLILGFDLVVVLSLFYPFRQYLLTNGKTVQWTEVWSFSMATPVIQIIMLLSFLMLICDFPYMDQGFELYILRTTKRRWLASQYKLLLIMTAFFLGFWLILLCPMESCSLEDHWSTVMARAVNLPQKDSTGITWDFRVVSGWIYGNTPGRIFLQTMVLQFLKYYAVGLAMLMGNVLNLRNQSIVGIFLLWLLDYSITEMDCVEALFYISPFTLTRLNCLNLGFEYEFPEFSYAVGMMLGIIAVLMLVMRQKVKRLDFHMANR